MALVVAQEVPTSSSMTVSHGPSGARAARHRMRERLGMSGVPEGVVDDAELVLSELLSNAFRHGRPLGGGLSGGPGADEIRAAWRVDEYGQLTVEVTDGGGPTRPFPATPSVTARGGRGLNIIRSLTEDWGVRDEEGGAVTVWARFAPVSRTPGPGDGLGGPLRLARPARPARPAADLLDDFA
ncbi:ATP-binding protein [Streptomyces zingiberis]|uniref:ATP-binding protein n=1 Tax=Streptomyces zingiberis TaxID=2053010 RepID=UPI0035D51D8B